MSAPTRVPCIEGCGALVRKDARKSGRCRTCVYKVETRRRMLAAIEAPTLREAMDAYGRNNNTFWRAVRRLDLESTVQEKYAADLEEGRRVRAAQASAAALKGRDVANERAAKRAAERRAALVEDADWLARTGEHPVNAAKRLGYNSPEALERALIRAGAPSIMPRLWENDGMHERVA